MYSSLKRFFLVIVAAAQVSALNTTSSRTDFFKPSPIRLQQRFDYVMSYAHATNNTAVEALSVPMSNALESGSVAELVDLYAHQYSTKNSIIAPENRLGADISFMILILEKMVTFYYCKLDILESACHYWKWAMEHPTQYATAQSPYRWFCGGSFVVEAEQHYIHASQLRDQYSAEYGAVERLLGIMHADFSEPAEWLHGVQVFLSSILTAINPEKPNNDLRALAQKLVLYEKRIAHDVAAVKMPYWIQRNWLALTTGAVTVGALYAAYMQNQQMVDGFLGWGCNTTYKNFMDNCYNPAKSFINGIIYDEEIKKRYYIQAALSDTGEVLGYASTPKPLDLTAAQADKISQDLRSLGIKTGIEGRDLFLQLTSDVPATGSSYFEFVNTVQNKASVAGDGLTKTAAGGWQYLAGSDILLQRLMHEMNQFIDETKFNRRLISLIPATLLVYAGYKGLNLIYSWFTKKDRRALRHRLCQIEDLLIRTEHAQLADGEYGRLLYLLNKEYDQVMRNVPYNERSSFIDDLTYLAQAYSSVMQKKETVATMWRKYNSLVLPA